MLVHGRAGLDRSGQGPRVGKREKVGPVGAVTPVAGRRPPRDWARQNDRLRNMGDITVLFDVRFLTELRAGTRGRSYRRPIFECAYTVSALFHLPLRQTEGFLRSMFTMLERDPDLVPDYTTIHRHRTRVKPPVLPAVSGGVCLIVDATGCQVKGGSTWMFDKPGATDQRRARYVKLHLGIDADTGIPVASLITPSHGSGSGDASVGPRLISEAADHLYTCGGHLTGGIGDGAYDTTNCYQRSRARGGPWLAPPAQKARRGLHPDRDRHIDGRARLGDRYLDQVGYHQRSCVEATFGAMKRTVKLSSRASTFEQQTAEIGWQVHVYAQHLANTPR